MSKTRNIADLLDANGDVKSDALDNVPNEVVVSASEPSSPSEGDLWYDSNNEVLKIYIASSSAFAKVSPQIPTIASISGDITVETASNLTITGENFIDGIATVTFIRGATSVDVSVTPTSESEITVAVPSAIYTGASVGDSVSITVTNADVRTTSASTKTVLGRPVTLSSISGAIFNGNASTLTLTGVGFSATPLTVNFDGSNTATATVTNDTTATVAVPSGVYNQSSGTTFSITVTNADNITSSSVNTTSTTLPTGGTITNSGGYRIHTFTSSGTFTNTVSNLSVEYLVIAGGGAGGAGYGGGGGAGGYRNSVSGETSGANSSAESPLILSTGNKTVTVGAGATSTSAGYNAGYAVNGNNSVFDTITALGGGGGANTGNGNSGGSGGGGMDSSNAGGAGTSGQGFQGGNASSGTPNYGSGGGGGASSQGVNGTPTVAGNGGNGLASSITGSSVTRAGGGGGGTYRGGTSGSGGSGGGGNAGSSSSYPDNGDAGTVNTGSGGGGASADPYSTRGGNGGSGIVILRYQL